MLDDLEVILNTTTTTITITITTAPAASLEQVAEVQPEQATQPAEVRKPGMGMEMAKAAVSEMTRLSLRDYFPPVAAFISPFIVGFFF